MKNYQGYIAEGAGAARATRDKQLHIRVTEDQLARYQLAAERAGVTLSRWVIELCNQASTVKPGARPVRRAARLPSSPGATPARR